MRAADSHSSQEDRAEHVEIGDVSANGTSFMPRHIESREKRIDSLARSGCEVQKLGAGREGSLVFKHLKPVGEDVQEVRHKVCGHAIDHGTLVDGRGGNGQSQFPCNAAHRKL